MVYEILFSSVAVVEADNQQAAEALLALMDADQILEAVDFIEAEIQEEKNQRFSDADEELRQILEGEES